MSETTHVKSTEPIPVPAVLLDQLRNAARDRGMWIHNAVEEALKLWLCCERRQKRRRKPHPKHEQLTGDDIRTLVRLRLSRSEAVVECVCGEQFNSETIECQCPKCGALIRIEWRAS
jgi:hypothetical protein